MHRHTECVFDFAMQPFEALLGSPVPSGLHLLEGKAQGRPMAIVLAIGEPAIPMAHILIKVFGCSTCNLPGRPMPDESS